MSSRGLQVVRSHQRHEAVLHFVVREVEQERAEIQVIIFNGQITALVNHRQRLLHIGLVVDELLGTVITAGQFVQVLLRVVQQADEIGRCTAGEPIVAKLQLRERVQQTKGIIDIRQVVAEMIAVVAELQLLPHPFRRRPVSLGQFFYRLSKIAVQFVLRDATQSLVLSIHADVIGLVETAEHTDL